MSAFFASMTFPRWVIVTMLLASGVLGWMVFEKTRRLADIHLELARVPTVVKEIQELGLRLDQLQDLKAQEGVLQGQDPDFYIRKIAQEDAIGIGQVDIAPRKTTPKRGLVDQHHKIKPSNKNRSYSRGQIGNFLYKLEAESRRVKVTSFKISHMNRVKPGEVGDDAWKFEAEITTRDLSDDG